MQLFIPTVKNADFSALPMVDTFLWYENKILGAKIYYENAQLIYYPTLMIR